MTQPFTRSTPIWIYNKNEELKLILDPKSGIPHFDSWYIEQLNGAVNLEFSVPASDPRVSEIENDGRAVIRDQDGNFIEFIIRQPEDTNDSNGPIKKVFAEGGDYELIDEWMTGYKADNVTLKTALEAVLSNTRWSVGIVDDFGTNSVDLKPMSVKSSVYELVNLFGGERQYRVDVDTNIITNRYIDVLKRRGQNNGKRFEHAKDIDSVRRTIDSAGIKTALYGYGASGENDGPRATFADVEWIKANGDPADKPLGQTWIGDPEALKVWGYDKGRRHRFGEYSGQEEDPATLLFNTWNHLQTLNDAVRTYEFKVILLEKVQNYGHEAVRLGDTVLGIDREIQPNIDVAMDIIEYRQNLNDDQLDEVTVGNYRYTFDAAVRTKNTEQILDNSRGKWDKKETPEGSQTKANAALEEAERQIGLANQAIATAVGKLETAEQDIIDAQTLIDAVTSEDEYGMTVLNGTLVTNKIIAENAILTGTITGSNAVIKDLTVQNATITGTLNSVDGTFTGTLSGVDGTFIGTLTGNAIQGANITGSSFKTDSGTGYYVEIESGHIISHDGGGAYSLVNKDGFFVGFGYGMGEDLLYLSLTKDGISNRDGGNLKLNDNVTVTGNLTVNGSIGGTVSYASSAGSANSISGPLNTQLTTNASETGFCGVGGMAASTTTGSVAGTGVNFRVKKTYTPSSVSFSQIDASVGYNYTSLTTDGFWLYVRGTGTDGDYCYWRGTYTA